MAAGYARTEPDEEALEEYATIPEGRYLAAITASEVRESRKNPASRYLWLQWEIQDGPQSGRKVWQILNLWNQNPKAVAIAQRETNQILDALGLLKFDDSTELHDRTMSVRIGIRPAEGAFKEGNEIAGVAPARQATKAPTRPKRPPAKEPEEPTELPDDDIPF